MRRPHVYGASLVIRHENHLLVVCQSYRYGLDLPGGGRAGREPSVIAACREAREEIGLIVNESELVFTGSGKFRVGGRTIAVDFFEWVLAEKLIPRIDDREIIWAGWRHQRQLMPEQLSTGLRFYWENLR